MLDLIRQRLEAAGIAYALLTGDTKDRAGAVAAFQEGPAPVFLISLKAGGVGLNLTAADTVILYDPGGTRRLRLRRSTAPTASGRTNRCSSSS